MFFFSNVVDVVLDGCQFLFNSASIDVVLYNDVNMDFMPKLIGNFDWIPASLV